MNRYKKTHQPCEDCGSSDGKTYFADGGTYCFVCQKSGKKDGNDIAVVLPEPTEKAQPRANFKEVENLLVTGEYRGIPERGITSVTAQKYSVMHTPEKTYFGYFSEDDHNKPVAAKIRYPDKKFPISGDWAKAQLFGQQLFPPSSAKYLTITEGEFDALAAYQMQGSKFPVVSIRNGAQAALKDCKAAYEYIDSFESVVISFDNDEPGQKAAREVAELFGGKARIMKHPKELKDACDYLKAGLKDEFTAIWWAAEKYIPDGIVNGASMWKEVSKPVKISTLMYPFGAMNDLTYGIREGELVTVTAGSGLGKSQFLREIIFHVLRESEGNIGLLMLEESARKTVESIMALYLNKPIHLPDVKATKEERWEAFENTMGNQRVHLFNHFGSTGVDNIISRIRYMAKAMDCRYVFLDHVTMVVSAQSNGDERKALDEIMTKLRMLVEETGISLFAVSHLKRPDTKGHEEGAVVSLAQLRGSGSIAQLSDMVIGLERNGQAEDKYERNLTKVRILKNRFSGLTGTCTSLYFNQETGRLTEVREENPKRE